MESLTNAQEELYNWLADYIREHQHSPSIRQMMRAMGLKSPAPIQSRLDHLRKKGYIGWNEGKARTIRILQGGGIPIKGAIAAGSMVEAFLDIAEEFLDLSSLPIKSRDYALRVRGDSMVDALIDNGDFVIMRPVDDPQTVKDGTIVAARVESATTLKYLYRQGEEIVLKPANSNYELMVYPAQDVDIQGRLLAVWRSHDLA
ncbi:MAG: repressor LexA [Leptolyngbya sp. SIO3F4]|nr:repressor LexA [Leptolyngbya sp. SIO3F4]